MGLMQEIYKKIEAEGIIPELQELYSMYGGRALVASKLGISYGSVGHIASHFGFGKSRHERRSVEKYKGTIRDPFDGSDFGDYLIGYIIGDGSIEVKNGRVCGFSISSSDLEHITKIRDMWDKSLKIYGSNKGNYVLRCFDTELTKKLLSYGLVPSKSKVGMILTTQITWPLFRGLFDSDGSVTIINNGTGLRVMIAGGRDYISQFEKFVGVEPGWHDDRKTFICSYYSTFSVVKTIRDSMYEGSTIFLQRKYERFYKPDKYKVNRGNR